MEKGGKTFNGSVAVAVAGVVTACLHWQVGAAGASGSALDGATPFSDCEDAVTPWGELAALRRWLLGRVGLSGASAR